MGTRGGNSATPATELATRRGGRPGGRDRQGQEHRASLPGWEGHLPGQHIDVRLTAEDGYQAQRSYSIATRQKRRHHHHGRAHRGWRGLALPLRGAGGRRPARAAWTHRWILRMGAGSRRTPAARGGGQRSRPADGHGAVEGSFGGAKSPFGCCCPRAAGDGVISPTELETVGSMPGVEVIHTLTRSQPPGGPATAAASTDTSVRGRLAAIRPPAVLRVRPHRVGRGGSDGSHRPRATIREG